MRKGTRVSGRDHGNADVYVPVSLSAFTCPLSGKRARAHAPTVHVSDHSADASRASLRRARDCVFLLPLLLLLSDCTAQREEPPPDVVAVAAPLFTRACSRCHGVNGEGTRLGPNLQDNTWLLGNGSRNGIARVIAEGVAAPKQFPAPMPPGGGTNLTEAEVDALSWYVLGLGSARARDGT
jgi:mono/diheme cytochrome c family protein